MSLTLVLTAWALVLLIPAVIKMRNRGIHTSVSKFHDQLIVLGRTSTVSGHSAEVHTTQTYLFAHSSTSRVQTRGFVAPNANTVMAGSPAEMRRFRQTELRQRRTMIVFSLLVLFLVSALVMVLALSLFTAVLAMSSLIMLALYMGMLIRIRNTAVLRAQYRARAESAAFEYQSALAPEEPRASLTRGKSSPIRIAKTYDVARAN